MQNESFLIEVKDSSDIKLLLELAHKLNIKTQILSIQDKEDMALEKGIVEEERGENVRSDELLKINKTHFHNPDKQTLLF